MSEQENNFLVDQPPSFNYYYLPMTLNKLSEQQEEEEEEEEVYDNNPDIVANSAFYQPLSFYYEERLKEDSRLLPTSSFEKENNDTMFDLFQEIKEDSTQQQQQTAVAADMSSSSSSPPPPPSSSSFKKQPSSPSSTISELKRQIHIQSEQKRRAQIKDGFEELRNELPTCLNKKMSKVTLLHKTVQHIQHLKNTQTAILAELERLVNENEQLRKFKENVLGKQHA
ncbi:uncharacterized protein BX663DRAFT_483919 [Cokeromyces recurvatus]|uniref:uncharacterized protein n=1 Tax=Cokeromyces recurvatus TaxID=90255 RepID=UPI00221F3A1D|nr:uncharacterized protein BX663DRAFT_483919 [Cokeromyces recurvatus]KAI7905399.1 hypothetical protein BX663DRAFT_483919 [Cokeromyces recurvatus]